ncbi:hypothetical protein DFQ27_007953 [Actinomortierella ambigua]|uniref:Uncharacterized protein n=1 Tax=Actinomortierella ambigua TaxID=1343610 RepID=A0A9P6TZD5_9FUNG|nr:hypothetical protein DFQ27_007953 [Actinomortierella ambigua]
MHLVKPLFFLCSASAVMAQSQTANAIVSGAILIGKDTTQSIDPVLVFRDPKNHLTAAASIVVSAANRVSFQPTKKTPKTLVPAFGNFQIKLASFPGFINSEVSESSLSLNGSFTQFEKEVRDANKDQDSPIIARSLRDLIPGHIKDKGLKKWILSLLVFKKLEGTKIQIKLARVTLTVLSDQTHTTYIPKQTADYSTGILEVNSAYLTASADKWASVIPIVKVRDAIDFLTSPKASMADNFLAEPEYDASTCGGHRLPRIQQDIFI